jgi:hypothetical protein
MASRFELRKNNMDDFRLVAARRMRWNSEAWREPAQIALVIRGLEEIVYDQSETAEAQAEAKMLIAKLRSAGKEPPLA